MTTNFLWNAGTSNNGLIVSAFNLMTTELESLTNTTLVSSSVGGSSGLFTNSNTAQAMWADLFFNVGSPGIGSALTTGAALQGWFLTSFDGSTFEPTALPARPSDFIIPMPATTITALNTYKTAQPVLLPAINFKVLVQNSTGQTFGSGGTTVPYLKCAAYAIQY